MLTYGSIYLTDFYTYYLLLVFSCLNLFPDKKIRSNTLEAPFGITGASTETENVLRVNLIVEREIGFLLEFYQYSSD